MIDLRLSTTDRPTKTLIDLILEHADGDEAQAEQWLHEALDSLQSTEPRSLIEQKWFDVIGNRVHDWSYRRWGKAVEDRWIQEMKLELSITRSLIEEGGHDLEEVNERLKLELQARN